MNQLIISNPSVQKLDNISTCPKCSIRPFTNPIIIRRHQINCPYTSFDPYKNNMTMCNQNFNRVEMINNNLKNQIEQSNAQIVNLNSKIDRLEQIISNNNTQMQNIQQNIQVLITDNNILKNLINKNNDHIDVVQKEIVTLNQKFGKIINFIPEFVKRTSQFFVKLVVGINTKTLGDIGEFDYDTHMLN